LCMEFLGYSDMTQIPQDFLDAVDQMERGELSEQGWLAVFQKVTENRFSDDELRYAWNLLIGDDMEGMPELVKEITDLGYRFVFFSDTSELHILHMYRKLSFAHLVSGKIYSYDVGAKKPEAKMYEVFEKTFGKPCFYLDDRPSNIEAARKRGWQSHLFADAKNFREDFFKVSEIISN